MTGPRKRWTCRLPLGASRVGLLIRLPHARFSSDADTGSQGSSGPALRGLCWASALAEGERRTGRGPPPRARDGARADDHFEAAIKKTSRQLRHPRRHPPPLPVASPSCGTVRATLTTRCSAVLASPGTVERRGSTRAAQTVEPRDACYILACPIRRRIHDAETSTLWRGHPPTRLAAGGSLCANISSAQLGGFRRALCSFLSPCPPWGGVPGPPLASRFTHEACRQRTCLLGVSAGRRREPRRARERGHSRTAFRIARRWWKTPGESKPPPTR